MTEQDNELYLEQVTGFMEYIQSLIENNENAEPFIYFHDNEYTTAPSKDDIPELVTLDEIEIVVDSDELKEILDTYQKGVKEGKTAHILTAVTRLLNKLTKHEGHLAVTPKESGDTVE